MKSRRRSKPKLNLVDTGVSLVVANAVTQGLGNANLMDFITGRRDGKYVAGSDGTMRLTIPELFTGVTTSNNYDGGLGSILAHNFKKNGMQMLGTVIFTPVLAKMGKKLLRKPVLTPLNKVIKATGLDVKV